MEVDLAERDEQHHEHEHGQDGGENGVEEECGLMELWGEGKNEVGHGARAHGERQCPVFYESDDVHSLFTKEFSTDGIAEREHLVPVEALVGEVENQSGTDAQVVVVQNLVGQVGVAPPR